MEVCDVTVVQVMSLGSATTAKCGLCHALVTQSHEPKANDPKRQLHSALSNIEALVFDFADLQAAGWLGDDDNAFLPLQAAHCAFALLEQWSRVVEGSVAGGRTL